MTSAAATMSLTREPLLGRVDVAHARAEVHDLEAAPVEDVGVAAAAHAGGARSGRPTRSAAARTSRMIGASSATLIGCIHRLDRELDVRARDGARRRPRSRRACARTGRRACAASWLRASPRSATSSGTMLIGAAALDRCRGWRWSRGRCGRGAWRRSRRRPHWIALMPRSGAIPACAARPWTDDVDAVRAGRAREHEADRVAVEDEPAARARPARRRGDGRRGGRAPRRW